MKKYFKDDNLESFFNLEVAKRKFNTIDPYDPFQLAYEYFINYFKNEDVITEADFFIAANFTYGWMPTMLKYKSENIKNDLKIGVALLNKVKFDGKKLDGGELEALTHIVNNSIVGSSKLLHFIRPDLYPIWDSRVNGFLKDNKYTVKGTSYVNSINKYLAYIELCQKIINNNEYEKVHKLFVKQFKEKHLDSNLLTKLRSIEQLMFLK